MYPAFTNDCPEPGAAPDLALLRARRQREEFLSHFGFREAPFGVTPDPGFLFFSAGHRNAFQAMVNSIESNLGFTVLLGEPGLGKTTLLFQLLAQYRDCARTAFVFLTQCKPHDLIRYIAAELELPGVQHDEVSLHQRLNETLLKEAHAGRKVLIIIDEAQNLHHSTLEAIRLLSGYETPSAKLLHIVLAGSARLGETLLTSRLSPLAQRITTVCRLQPLNAEEIKEYVIFRLGIAGFSNAEGLFPAESLAAIADKSGGVPRLVNSICSRALLLAFASGERQVSCEVVQQAARELDLSESGGRNSMVSKPLPQTEKPDLLSQLADEMAAEKSAVQGPYKLKQVLPQPRLVEEPGVRAEEVEDAELANSLKQRLYSRPPDKTTPAKSRDQGQAVSTVPSKQPSAVRLRIPKLTKFTTARLKHSRSAVWLAALIVLALGLWMGRHQLGTKLLASGQNSQGVKAEPVSTENQDANVRPASENQEPGVHSPSAPPANVPDATGAQNTEPTGQRQVGAAKSHVVETLPETLVPSRTSRLSSRQAEPAPPVNIASISGASGDLPLVQPPVSLPRLDAPGATNQSPNVPRISSQKPTKVVQPEYPKLAKLKRVEGEVLLELEVDSKGNVHGVRTLSGNPLLKQAAEEAARHWRYSPSQEQSSGPSVTQVRFNFKLNAEARK
jgi:TonB family protein